MLRIQRENDSAPSMTLIRSSAGNAAILWLAVSLSKCAIGCTLCINFPEKTDVDFLADSNCVILARPTMEDPFTYSPTETLKGSFDGNEIGLLVDSMTRRVLAAESNRSVLLYQEFANGDWKSLGVVSDQYLPMVRRILVLSKRWSGEAGRTQRWQFFLPWFGHDDPRIRQLAYLELGRAPYSALKRLGKVAPRDAYTDMLADPKYLKWKSLAILLLGQSEDPNDKQTIRDAFSAAQRLAVTTNLAAWTAAVIEVDGDVALNAIEDHYFGNAARSVEETDAIFQALSMHGSNDDGMEDTIVQLYRRTLRAHPEYAPRVAEDLMAWERFELKTELNQSLLGNAFREEERRSIRRYLRAAAEEK